MLDIIIPAFNAHNTINRTLASIAMQSLEDLKVFIVDDASDSDYESVVQNWSPFLDISLIRLPVNSGPGTARQTGLDAGSGEFVTFIDADDSLACSFSLRRLYNASDNCDIIYGAFSEELEDGRLIFHGENMTWLFAKLYSRTFLDKFDIRFNSSRANEDTGFNSLAACLASDIRYIPETIYLWHFRNDSLTRTGNFAYASGEGFSGYVENFAWFLHELYKRAIPSSTIAHETAACICNIYFTLLPLLDSAPRLLPKLLSIAKSFSDTFYSGLDHLIPPDLMRTIFLSVQNARSAELATIIPVLSFQQFLNMLSSQN